MKTNLATTIDSNLRHSPLSWVRFVCSKPCGKPIYIRADLIEAMSDDCIFLTSGRKYSKMFCVINTFDAAVDYINDQRAKTKKSGGVVLPKEE